MIESRKDGKNNDAYLEVSGPWLDSNVPASTAKSAAPGLSAQGRVGTRKTVIESAIRQSSSTIVAAARFQVKVPRPGRYYVYVTWPKAANANPIQYVVRHGNSVDAVPMFQDGWGTQGRSNADSWNLIGGYDFTMSGDEFVELQVPRSAVGPKPDSLAQAYTDGIRITSSPLPSEEVMPTSVIAAMPAGDGTSLSTQGGATPTTAPISSATGVGPLQWSSSFELARSEASATNRGLLLFFVNASSERVRKIEADVIDTPRVRQAIAGRYIPVKIDMATNGDLARRLQVFRAGTVLIYDNQLQGLAEITDPRTPEDIISRLR